MGLAIVDYACVTYHFAAQHFGALSLYRARAERGWSIQTRRLDRFFALTVGGVLVFAADILAGAVAYQDQWIDRWLFPRVDCVGAERNSRWCDPGAVYRDSGDVMCRGACAAVVVATRIVHCWPRGNGWHRSSSPEFVSLPGDLDIPALDSRHGLGRKHRVRSWLRGRVLCVTFSTN